MGLECVSFLVDFDNINIKFKNYYCLFILYVYFKILYLLYVCFFQNFWECDFFEFRKENIVRVILIKSDFIGVIDVKLEVYRNYRFFIDLGMIVLYYVYDEYDEIVKLSVYCRILYFSDLIVGLINFFLIEFFGNVICKVMDKMLIKEKIEELCFGVFIKYENEIVGLV